jgi:hypothetical protein
VKGKVEKWEMQNDLGYILSTVLERLEGALSVFWVTEQKNLIQRKLL